MAFFRAETGTGREILVPQDRARSDWGGVGQLRGTAVSGILARACERTAGSLEDAHRFRPARWTVDLMRPAGVAPGHVETVVQRAGRRLRLLDALYVQRDKVVARGTVLLLATDADPARGAVWTTPYPPYPAVPDLRPTTTEPILYYSEDAGWTGDAHAHQNATRKMTWHFPEQLVEGESPSPFACAATVADSSNLVTSWGERGVEFINTDLTLTLTRLPEGDGAVGLAAQSRTEADGISLATTVMFDRAGAIGTVVLSALANGAHAVDPRTVGTALDPA